MIVRVAKWLALAAGAAVAACTAFAAKDDSAAGAVTPDGGSAVDGAGAVSDGSTSESAAVDASVHADASPDVVVANDNLIVNGDFDDGCASPEWLRNSTTVADSPLANSPPTACNVCGVGATGSWSLFQSMPLDAPAGTKYRFEAWIRRPADAGTTASTTSCRIEVFDKNHASLQAYETTGVTPTTTFTKCTANLTISPVGADAGASMEMVVIGTPSSTCFLVDDMSLRKMP